jgi:hypothetical protein
MSTGRYFVDDKDEKAANWDILEELRQARKHRTSLTDAMLTLAKLLGSFSDALKTPEKYSIQVSPGEITIAQDQRTQAVLNPTHLNWERAAQSLD